MENCNNDRGTGRTTKQMQAAPHGAVFVWCNSHVWYAKDLARRLGRSDLDIISPDHFQWHYFAGKTITGLMIDHAFMWEERYWEALDFATQRIRNDGNKGA